MSRYSEVNTKKEGHHFHSIIPAMQVKYVSPENISVPAEKSTVLFFRYFNHFQNLS
jgi:hypothetical protein